MSATEVPARWWAGSAAVPRTADTAADMRRYLEDGLTPVNCTRCATTVLVKKNSLQHTSVQWTSDAASSCPEICAQVAAGARGAQILGCTALKKSIEDAVRAGVVAVPDD